jgi:hypothetical protein
VRGTRGTEQGRGTRGTEQVKRNTRHRANERNTQFRASERTLVASTFPTNHIKVKTAAIFCLRNREVRFNHADVCANLIVM